jgi:glycosyltransferase involved in cell wall biosynthesis
MVGKVDLVMWTKNGAKTLPHVLKRINQVSPPENVGNRIIVDDKSTDQTDQTAQRLGWQVVPNKGSGIADGANTALGMVQTEWFASFEQDVLLSADWWRKIPGLLNQPSTVVASGLRIPNTPLEIKRLEEYTAQRFLSKASGASGLEVQAYGKTLDNTIYKTDTIRQLGGFPKPPVPAGIDTILNHKLNGISLKWTVDYTVRSVHLRKGLRDELKHYRMYSECVDAINQMQTGEPYPLKNLYKRLLLGPARGFLIAFKTRTPQIIYVYPLIRLEYIRGIAAYRRKTHSK